MTTSGEMAYPIRWIEACGGKLCGLDNVRKIDVGHEDDLESLRDYDGDLVYIQYQTGDTEVLVDSVESPEVAYELLENIMCLIGTPAASATLHYRQWDAGSRCAR